MVAGDIISILEACSYGVWADPRSVLSRFESAEPLHTGQVVRLVQSRSGSPVEVVAASCDDEDPPLGVVVKPHPDGTVDISNSTLPVSVLMGPGEAQDALAVGSFVYLAEGGRCTLSPTRVRIGVLVEHTHHNFALVHYRPMISDQ